jgi:hypothetical protein
MEYPLTEYISTSVYRRFLAMLAASGLKLPETVNLTIDGAAREFTVLHKIELSEYPPQQGLIEPVMSITSWAVVPTEGLSVDPAQTEVVDAERDWVKHGHFWVGAVSKVYRDYLLAQDKKLNGFGWCGNAERELAFASFCLLKAGPLFTTQIKLSSLELFTPPQQVGSSAAENKPARSTKVGTIDGDGAFTPAVPVDNVGTEALEPAAHSVAAEVPQEPVIPEVLRTGASLGGLVKRLFPFQQSEPASALS